MSFSDLPDDIVADSEDADCLDRYEDELRAERHRERIAARDELLRFNLLHPHW